MAYDEGWMARLFERRQVDCAIPWHPVEYNDTLTVEEAFELHADEALAIANATFDAGAEAWSLADQFYADELKPIV